MDGLTITRIDHGDHGEYRAHPAGSAFIGRLTWVQQGNLRIAEHTLVPRQIGGRGIGTRLAETLVADARAKGLKIVPRCSFVRAKFEQNPDWADVRA